MTNILMWVLLAAIIAWCAYWHIRENKQLVTRWQGTIGLKSAQEFAKIIWARTLQLLAAMLCFSIVVIMYDWQLIKARAEIGELVAQKEINAKQIAELKQAQTASPSIAPDNLEPIAPNQPAIELQPAPQASESPIEAVYDSQSATAGGQATLDDIKNRYETMLVNYFFLKKCGRTGSLDYHVITSALSQEMASINAPGRLQNDILTAAQGSYKEVYTQASCTSAETENLYTQYSSYIATISEQFKTE